jgi:hypothetical protein
MAAKERRLQRWRYGSERGRSAANNRLHGSRRGRAAASYRRRCRAKRARHPRSTDVTNSMLGIRARKAQRSRGPADLPLRRESNTGGARDDGARPVRTVQRQHREVDALRQRRAGRCNEVEGVGRHLCRWL